MSYAYMRGSRGGRGVVCTRSRTFGQRYIARWIAVAAITSGVSLTAHAGDVTGTVKIDRPTRLKPPPQGSRGFTNRLPNPLKPVRRYNPRPYMIVVLESEAAAASSGPKRARYELLGESFAVPVLAVEVGTEVEIKNDGTGSPVLFSPSHRDKLSPAPLNPSSTVAFTVDTPHAPVELRAEGVSHLRGRVVGFPHRYFAQVDRRGNFSIADVPPGKWKVRVWYRDGWLARSDETIEVGGRGKRVDPKVSHKLERVGGGAAK